MDAVAQPIGPSVNALTLRRCDGENRCLRIELGNFVAESFLVEIEHAHGVDLVQDNGLARLENAGILQRLVVAFWHGQNHDLGAFAQVEIGGTHEVAHIFDNDEVEVVQVERIDRATNHVAFKMARATRVDLHRSNALSANALRIDVARDIAFDNGDVELVAQRFNGGQNGRRFA